MQNGEQKMVLGVTLIDFEPSTRIARFDVNALPRRDAGIKEFRIEPLGGKLLVFGRCKDTGEFFLLEEFAQENILINECLQDLRTTINNIYDMGDRHDRSQTQSSTVSGL